MSEVSAQISQQPVCNICPAGTHCDNPFDRVVVSFLLRGGTRVMWELKDEFLDPMPYTFQLQVGQSRDQEADDWTDVGAPMVNMYAAVDGEQRIYGKLRNLFYRVKLTTSLATYYSAPVGADGTLKPYDWKLAKNIIREHLVRMRHTNAGQAGFLLKRRISGTPCPQCLDYQTNEVKNPGCEFCHGTGFLCGYFFPIDCIWADVSPRSYHTNVDSTLGTTSNVVVKAMMINTWMLAEEDIWVNQATDDRWYIHSVQNIAEYRGVPLVASVELRLAPVSDPAYAFIIPQQVTDLATERT